jgi:predicted TIM-barrel fold metal-dependent hydrolase
LWTQRLPAAFKERAPQVVDTPGGPYWVCDGKSMGPWGAYTAAQGSGNMWALEVAGVMQEGVLRPTMPELRLADMDRDGIDASVMYGPTDPFQVDDPVLRRLCYQAFDDWVAEFSSAKPDRLIGVAQLCHEDPEAAAQELERVARLGLRHVNLLAARAAPPVYDGAWEPFWAMAEETGIPVGFHLAVDTRRTRSANGAVDAAVFGIMQAQQLIEPVAGIIVTGVLDRYPKLKIVMAESGLAWVPHMIQTLDRQWEKGNAGQLDRGGSAGPTMRPSDYFRRQIWMTFQDDPAGVHMLPSHVGLGLSAPGQHVAQLTAHHRRPAARHPGRPPPQAPLRQRPPALRPIREVQPSLTPTPRAPSQPPAPACGADRPMTAGCPAP